MAPTYKKSKVNRFVYMAASGAALTWAAVCQGPAPSVLLPMHWHGKTFCSCTFPCNPQDVPAAAAAARPSSQATAAVDRDRALLISLVRACMHACVAVYCMHTGPFCLCL